MAVAHPAIIISIGTLKVLLKSAMKTPETVKQNVDRAWSNFVLSKFCLTVSGVLMVDLDGIRRVLKEIIMM